MRFEYSSGPDLFHSLLKFDLIWDRASFVALNPDDRQRYVSECMVPWSYPDTDYFLVAFEYDKSINKLSNKSGLDKFSNFLENYQILLLMY